MEKKARTIFIWDIHGCYDEFKLIVEKLELQENDTVYCVWDLINRGNKSYKVLKYFYKHQKQFKTIVWNHEINFLRWLDGKKYKQDKKFKKLKEKIEEHDAYHLIDYIKSLPRYIETDDFLLIHGWLIPWKKLEEYDIDEIVRTRIIDGKHWSEHYTWEKKVIYWHYAQNWLQIKNNTIWLDTGCVYWKWLTAYTLETWEIISQTSLDAYIDLYSKKWKSKNSDNTLIVK
jgi:bis(5'-nucleosyl)-tetraphosphatase (symmetrical)